MSAGIYMRTKYFAMYLLVFNQYWKETNFHAKQFLSHLKLVSDNIRPFVKKEEEN